MVEDVWRLRLGDRYDTSGHRKVDADYHAVVKVATGPIQTAFEHALTEKSPQFLALTLNAMSFMGNRRRVRAVLGPRAPLAA